MLTHSLLSLIYDTKCARQLKYLSANIEVISLLFIKGWEARNSTTLEKVKYHSVTCIPSDHKKMPECADTWAHIGLAAARRWMRPAADADWSICTNIAAEHLRAETIATLS